MFNKLNNKILGIVFGTLLLLVIVVLIKDNSKSTANRNRSFKSELCEFDTAKVNSITIYPKANGNPVSLNKHGDKWSVAIENKEYNASSSAVKNILTTLTDMRAMRIAATSKNQWEKYEVTDSAATRVEVKAGKKTLADITVGKFSYQQPKQSPNQNPYMQQQRGKLTSYVRLTSEKEVYAVDGMISLSFNRDAKDFRDHTLIQSKKDAWETITVTMPNESYVLKQQGLNWTVDGLETDSAKVADYFTSIAYLSSGDFIDEETIADKTPSHIITIEGAEFDNPIEVTAFANDTTSVIAMSSSLNEGTYFDGKPRTLLTKLFKNKAYFIKPSTTE